jgi:hypothetical protein
MPVFAGGDDAVLARRHGRWRVSSLADPGGWLRLGLSLSGVALIGLAYGGSRAPDWPLPANIFALGLFNGMPSRSPPSAR